MSSDYTYDEQGQFFPFFILTITGLITLPLTYNVLKPNTDLEETAPRIQSDFKPKDDELIQGQKRLQKRRERKLKRMIVAGIGYLVMAWMVYLIIVTARAAPKIWDPYDILGISRSADEKAIKKFYNRLSLKFHPDKARPDESKNETIEMLNDRWVEMSKAYKALTDEDVRNNYLQFGHPDGKQSYSIGIALPKFIIAEGNGKYVLLFYGLLLGILLPYAVGKWWYGTQALTKDKVLVPSASNLFREYKEDMSQGSVIGVLSSGNEFHEMLKGPKADTGTAKTEKSILADAILSAEDQARLKEVDDPVRRKALALIWAYLSRKDLDNTTLEEEKYEAAPIAFRLNDSLTSISLAFGIVEPLLSCHHTSQNLIQAIPPNGSPLLQLPYITPKIAQSFQGAYAKSQISVHKLMALPESARRNLCSSLSDSQYASAMQVAQQMPYLSVAKAFFKVQGDRVITPSSLVQLVVKARLIPPGSKNVPEVNELELEDVDPDEDDLEALLGRKRPKNMRTKTVDGKPIDSGEDDGKAKSIQPPLANAPYFAQDHSPRWHIFLADARQGRVAVPPFTFTSFDKPIFDSEGKPTFNMQTLKCQFQAPPQVGSFNFSMYLICDSYIGLDTKMDLRLEVEDVSKAVVVESDDEISEPDEDTLAGQMQALKTGGLTGPAPKRKSRKSVKDESSEDESDTDGEAADDTSETDTETDTDGD